jgi:5-formyltetrahydrofolate cyclo-ligase
LEHGLVETAELTQSERIEAEKAALRLKAAEARSALSSQDRAAAAQQAVEHFFAEVPLQRGQAISAYWPIRDELDTRPLLIRLMDDGWRVCLPVVGGPELPLVFRRWEVGAPLYPAGMGMLEPGEAAPETVPDVVVMPLLGFDRSGTRLGYGGGYYDRTLQAMGTKPLLVGYAFAAQELETIPHQDHDVPLDMLVTENGVVRFTAAAG